MKRTYDDPRTQPLPLMGGVVQAQRLVVPPQVVMGLASYRHACRLAWKLRNPRISQRTLAELAGLYPSHVSDYFSVHAGRRELPAKHVGAVCQVLGNTVIAQWLAQAAQVTLLEEMQSMRRAA
jgi:DNA-binding transcriptional regulator YdaS (Cro superfamily)